MISLPVQEHTNCRFHISSVIERCQYVIFFLTLQWVYPAHWHYYANYPPVHHLLSEIKLEPCILGLYYIIDSLSTKQENQLRLQLIKVIKGGTQQCIFAQITEVRVAVAAGLILPAGQDENN